MTCFYIKSTKTNSANTKIKFLRQIAFKKITVMNNIILFYIFVIFLISFIYIFSFLFFFCNTVLNISQLKSVCKIDYKLNFNLIFIVSRYMFASCKIYVYKLTKNILYRSEKILENLTDTFICKYFVQMTSVKEKE